MEEGNSNAVHLRRSSSQWLHNALLSTQKLFSSFHTKCTIFIDFLKFSFTSQIQNPRACAILLHSSPLSTIQVTPAQVQNLLSRKKLSFSIFWLIKHHQAPKNITWAKKTKEIIFIEHRPIFCPALMHQVKKYFVLSWNVEKYPWTFIQTINQLNFWNFFTNPTI